MDILVIDVGGSSVKIRTSGMAEMRHVTSGPKMTPRDMADRARALAVGWPFDVVAIGYPGVVRDGRPTQEPHNLAPGWIDFDYRQAFGRPVKIVNDAAMQAIGSYQSGRMLFLGLGTGLGSALIVYGMVQGLELSQLPYKDGSTFGDCLAQRGLDRLGLAAWQQEVEAVVGLLREALVVDHVVLGGGNVRLLQRMPAYARPGHNTNAFEGGFRLWRDPDIRI